MLIDFGAEEMFSAGGSAAAEGASPEAPAGAVPAGAAAAGATPPVMMPSGLTAAAIDDLLVRAAMDEQPDQML